MNTIKGNKMDKHEAYMLEKAKEAYGKYERGEYFEKARAIIVNDGKVAFIRNLKTEKITIPGGGVDEGETIAEAAEREAFEETGLVVAPITVLGENHYTVDMEFEGKAFPSKRVEYFYLCSLIEKDEGHSGLEGEYEEGIEIFFDTPDTLKKCNVSDEIIAKIKNEFTL